jgi:tRNA threonylcarbamoyladenosine biosynthesis protein TsaB
MTQLPIILAIDTSTDACSVALSTPDQIYSEFQLLPQGHAKVILDMINQVMIQSGLGLAQLDAFAYGKGPGSFTGLRIAASVIQGLAFGANKPVVAISSLQALAQQAFDLDNDASVLTMEGKHIVPILDARMQEVYCGVYKVNSTGFVTNVIADTVQKPEELILSHEQQYVAVGTGINVYADLIRANNSNLSIISGILYPRAQELVQLAQQEFLRGNVITAEQALPVYIRDDVAQTGKKNPD